MKFGANRTFCGSKTPVSSLHLYGQYQILWTDIAHFQYRPMANRSLLAKFVVRGFLRSDAIVITTDGRTDEQTDLAHMSQNFALIKCPQGTYGLRSIFLGFTHVLTKQICPLSGGYNKMCVYICIYINMKKYNTNT